MSQGLSRSIRVGLGNLPAAVLKGATDWRVFASLAWLTLASPIHAQNPLLVGTWRGDPGGDALAVAVQGDYAYVADGDSGLQVIDVSKAANPVRVGSHDFSGSALGVAVSGNYAYMAGWKPLLQIINISNPASPFQMGSYNISGGRGVGRRVALSGNYAYVADSDFYGLVVIDVANPSNPFLTATSSGAGTAEDVAVSGSYAYRTYFNGFLPASGLQALDVSNPSAPTVVGTSAPLGRALAVALSGNYAYVAAGVGLEIVDVSKPSSLVRVGGVDTSGWASGIAVSGNHAYVADHTAGLQVIDVSDPANPRWVGGHDTLGHAYAVAVSGNHIYVADREGGLVILEMPPGVGLVDLAVQDIQFMPAGVTAGGSLNVTFRVRNLGTNGTTPSIARLRLSQDSVLNDNDPGLAPLDVNLPALAVGASSSLSVTVTVPFQILPGDYYVGVEVDPDRVMNQISHTNDMALSNSRLTILGPPPEPPVIVVTNRTPPQELITRVAPSSAQLKVFTGGVFTNSTNIYIDRMTIVLTHGWNSGPMYWPSIMATQLVSAGIAANIIAWDWEQAAATLLNLDLALSRTCAQGERLGMALSDTLGTNYQREFHFIGHSLGTLVNRGAANYLHGDSKRRPPITNDPLKTHLTLLDDAELANFWGLVFGVGGFDRLLNGCYLGDAIPEHFAWIDSYSTFSGKCQGKAVNVFLPRGHLNHSYPHQWYARTVANHTASQMGHRWSFERDGVPMSDQIPNGSLLIQKGAPEPELEVRVATLAEQSQICGPPVLRDVTMYTDRNFFQPSYRILEATSEVGADLFAASYFGWKNITDAAADAAAEPILDWTYRLGLKKRPTHPPAPVPIGFTPAGGPNALPDSYAWLSLSIPTSAVGLSFQFRFLGVAEDDFLTVGISNTPLLMIESRFVAESNWMTTGVLDISRWAGQSVELFLGYSGASTNEGTIEVQAMQFYTLLGPELGIAQAGEQAVLSWPASAIGFQLQSKETLAGSSTWTAVTNAAALNLNTLVVTNDVNGPVKFYRLRRP